MRPVRKKKAIRRYEHEFPNVRRGEYILNEYEAQYCLSAEEDGESASTYDQVLQSKYKDESMRSMESDSKSLAQHETCTLKILPRTEKKIDCK